MQVIVDSLMTQYVRKGKGKTVLILHGWGDSSQGFQALTGTLSKHYDVIAVDLPGFGGTQAPTSFSWDVSDYAQFVAHFLDKIGVKDVYALVGHSNGGAVAIRGLGRGILRADRLVLLASAGIRNTYKGRNKMLRVVAKAGKMATVALPPAAKKKLRSRFYTSIGSDMLVAEHLQETFKRVVTDDVRDDAQRITVPSLLIYGENDQSTPVSYGEQFHEILPDSTLQIIGGVGHFVHLDKPEVVENAIEEFLK